MTYAAAPEWAIDRAMSLLGYEDVHSRGFDAVQTFARYVALHEQPPVDPDLIEAREICAKHTEARHPSEYRDGKLDDVSMLVATLAAIKRGRELERGQ